MASAPSALEACVEREANYAAVGAFVLLITAMAGLFVYWYAGGTDRRDYERYEIYFDGSVSGLNRGSTVRYLGVEVGRIHDIRIDARAGTRVQVIADIDSRTPITPETLAELSLQGVTGLLYIDLLARRGNKRVMDPVPSETYPVIGSVRSNLDVFLASLPDLVGKASEITERVALVLSDKNIAAFTNTMASLDQAATALPATMRDVQVLVRDLKDSSAQFRVLAANFRDVSETAGPDLKAAIGRARNIADNLASTTERLDQLVSENRADVQVFLRDGLPEMQRLLRDSRSAAQEFRELSRSLKSDPSQLLYEPSYRGVEIPR
jgi:phospholipid/cholesterol/gamma-HCH transport system substrate-binding protein